MQLGLTDTARNVEYRLCPAHAPSVMKGYVQKKTAKLKGTFLSGL